MARRVGGRKRWTWLGRALALVAVPLLIGMAARTSSAQDEATAPPEAEQRTLGETPHQRIGAMPDAGAAADGSVSWQLDALGQTFDLELQPNTGLVAELPADKLAGYSVMQGALVGNDASWVRLSETADGLTGAIFDGQQMFIVEPASNFDDLGPDAAAASVVYRAADIPAEPLTCDITGQQYPAHDVSTGHLNELIEASGIPRAAGDSTLRVLVVEDQDWTGDTVAIFNTVDGIYDSEVGLNLRIASTESASFNYGDGDPLQLFRTYMGGRTNGVGIGHLMAGGRQFPGNVVGKAYVNALCSSYGVGVSVQLGFNSMITLVAHEIGHNAAADHDTSAGCPSGFIMAPSVNGSRQFSDCSKSTIAQAIDRAGCLLSGEPEPPPPPPPAPPSTVNGQVTDTSGAGVAGVVVDLFADAGGGARGQWLGDTRTDGNGNYSFTVDDGCYVVTFIAPDGARFDNGDRWQNGQGCAQNGSSTTINATLVGVGGGDGEVTGNVSRNGSPVSGVTVDAFMAQADGSRGRWLGDVSTDGSGNYSFAAAPGCYVFTFIAPAGQTFTNGSQWYQTQVCLTAGETISGINATLR